MHDLSAQGHGSSQGSNMLKQTQITVYENEMHFIQCLKPESALESNNTRLAQLVVGRQVFGRRFARS
jgi:hypothetical protein